MNPQVRTVQATHSACLTVLGIVFLSLSSALAQSSWQSEWERVLAAAKNEGSVVVNIPPSAELREKIEAVFKPKFGINIELSLAASSASLRKVADEYQAGIRYFDVAFSTIDGLVDRLLPMGAIEPVEPYWILPEVKEPKHWWGGHIFGDKTRRFAYYPAAFGVDNLWYNASSVKPDEVRSYNDLLNARWKGKIGLYDPRIGGAGLAIWSFLRMIKGEDFMKKLAQQDLFVSTDRRLLADSLSRGKIAITMGVTYYSHLPFIKLSLPVKPFPTFEEGTYATAGNGGPVIIKNPPHPNATKVFMNWFLSREGQDLYSKAFGNATRRLDVDTKWMAEVGVRPAKDFLTLDQYQKYEISSEDKVLNVRDPGRELAQKLLR